MIFNRKNWSTLIIAVLLFATVPALAQKSVTEVKDAAITALKTGDSDLFTSFFNNPIDISLPNNDDSYSNTQARVIVEKFLLQYKVKSFEVKQTGNSTDGSVFIIGMYTATNGKVFRVYLLIKQQGDGAFVHLIEFEEE